MDKNIYMCSEELQNFCEKWKSDHGNTDQIDNHNIYFLKTVDIDGNVTGEAFALNVTLKDYFRNRFSTGSSMGVGFARVNMCLIGNGVYASNEDVSTTDTGLRAQTYTDSAVFSDTGMTRIDGSTFYWDADNSVLRADCKIFEGYFDYTLPGISGDLNITEIGLGYISYGNKYLFTHALVYDSNGDRTTFVKHVGEKLIVTAYVRILHKPEIETRMWNQGYAFMWNPWGCLGFGESNGGDWKYASGQATSIDSGIISSPRYETGSTYDYYDENSYSNPNRAGIICKKGITILEGTWDDTNQMTTKSLSFTDVNDLIESKEKYYDMFVAVIHNTYYSSGSGRLDYCSQGAVFTPLSLPSPEEIETDNAYCRDINSGDVSVNFGYIQNSKLDARGMLPVTNMNITSIKSYNGLTHDWDITETLTNGTNTTNLTMFQLYPWCGIYMYNKYMSDGVVKWGRFFDRIYANIYTSYPITSFDTTTQVWCTDTYWDTTSWEYIPDNTNVSAAQGSKKYYIRFDGSSSIHPTQGPDANLPNKAPMLVTRSGYTIPTIQHDALTTIQNVDPYSNGAMGGYDWGNAIMLSDYGTNGKRVHLSNDDMGYIYMSNKIYYPELGTSFDIVTSNGTGNCREPFHTLRFTEPSGHRVLQVFRASNYGAYPAPQLSKVSVFDIPSSTDLSQDPTLTPTEYIVELGSSFSNSIEYDDNPEHTISSTETGYVIFTNPTTNRAHVVNLLGVAPDYEPYQEIIKYPGTNNPATTYQIYAIKYTNNAVMIDYTITTSTDYGFTIFSLEDGSIIDQFTIPKSIWTANGGWIRYIVGWNGYLFISGTTTGDWNGEWKCRIYDPTRPQGSRVIDSGWSTTLSKRIIPRGDSRNEGCYKWNKLIDPHVYGDQSCIIFECSDNGNYYDIYYLDASNITSVVNISSQIQLPEDDHYTNEYSSLNACVMSFNNNKQRILCMTTNIRSKTNNCLFMDLNLIRDLRKGPSYVNISSAAIPPITPYYTSSTPSGTNAADAAYRAICTYKGKVVISEYSNIWRSIGGLYVFDTDTNTRFIDPNLLIQHKMTGTTTTIQAYNNPKRVYGINNITIKFINDATKWYPPAE